MTVEKCMIWLGKTGWRKFINSWEYQISCKGPTNKLQCY